MNDERLGSPSRFRQSWKTRQERFYTHWTRESPKNQIQLAFQQHFQVFLDLLERYLPGRQLEGLKVLEVGAGRGTMSMFFQDAGFDCTLLDVSDTVLQRARQVFQDNEMSASYVVADAFRLPFPERVFDVVFSIGLLEHFEDVLPILEEQVRVLAEGGVFLGYVVPENSNNVQLSYNWINELLRVYWKQEAETPPAQKEVVFRSDYSAGHYTRILKQLSLQGVESVGMYPLPMISPSPDFPFTLNPPDAEAVLVEHFEDLLRSRRMQFGRNGWLCDEEYGQAFLVWGRLP